MKKKLNQFIQADLERAVRLVFEQRHGNLPIFSSSQK
jgi:hypothetical protein